MDAGSSSSHRVDSGLLKDLSGIAGVGIGKVAALHHEDVSDAFGRIDPRLRAIEAAVAERAGREHSGDALRLADHAYRQRPAVAGRDSGLEFAGVSRREQLD